MPPERLGRSRQGEQGGLPLSKKASQSAKQSVSNYQSGRCIEAPTLYLSALVSILYTVRKWTLLNLAPAASQASRDVKREES